MSTRGDMRKVGAFWESETRGGEAYLSGTLDNREPSPTKDERLLIFRNGYKKNPKEPDYILYAVPRRDGPGGSNTGGNSWPGE